MKINGLNEISEIKSSGSHPKANKSNAIGIFGANGLSPVNRGSPDLDEQFTLQKKNSNEAVTDVYNFVNISKDDAESLMGLFKDFGRNHVTLNLGNGKELKIPKLNLEQLQTNFPLIH